MSEREWPGLPTAKPHGTPVDWELPNPDPFRYCESCGGQHHPRNTSCNGLRDSELDRCPSVLGEMRCHRPLAHLGACAADSAVLRVEWRIKTERDEAPAQ